MAGNQSTTLDLTGVAPNELVIGGQWTEVSLIGTGFKGKGLKAFITLPIKASKGKEDRKPVQQDEKILIEQPENDAIKDNEFPVSIKVLNGASDGPRNVILIRSLSELGEFGECKSKNCKKLDGGVSLIQKME